MITGISLSVSASSLGESDAVNDIAVTAELDGGTLPGDTAVTLSLA